MRETIRYSAGTGQTPSVGSFVCFILFLFFFSPTSGLQCLKRNTPREIFLEPPHSTDRRGGLEVRAGFISQPGPGTWDCLFAFRQTFCVPSPPVQTAGKAVRSL